MPTPHPARTKTISAQRSEWDRLMQRYDTNRDGAIDMQEVSQAALLEDRPGRASPISALLDSEMGRDGKLTRTEVKAFAQRTFKAIDTNKAAAYRVTNMPRCARRRYLSLRKTQK